jgi:nucleoside 2-deoxyribosyltransferase
MTAIVYCSGPLFCPEEQGGMAALARVLEAAGYATFLPQRDGLEAWLLRLAGSPLDVGPLRARADAAIFALDAYQIVERCAAVVCSLNGRVPDEGAVAEAALACAVGKPVVLYKHDRRAPFAGRDNAMLTGLSPLPPVANLRRVPAAVRRLLDDAPEPGPGGARLRAAVTLGRRIWQVMARAPAAPQGRSSRALVEEIAALCASPGTVPQRRGRGR